jgi:hypothetical protein
MPLEVPPGLRLFSGEVRHDLIPEGTVVGFGGLPWQELEAVRRDAQLHQPPHPERPTAGDALPVLILGMERAAVEHVARELDAASPEGIALIDVGGRVLVVIVIDSGMHGVAQLPAYTRSMAQFRLRLTATGGWHAIMVSTPTGQRGDPIYGFFEGVLGRPPGVGAGPVPPRISPRRPGGRKSRRGR